MTIFEKSYRPGQVIFSEGAPGDFAYLVCHGRVELLADRDNGRVRIATIGPGSLFGELALIDGSARMATAKAVEPTTCNLIDNTLLARKLKKLTAGQRELYQEMIDYVRVTPTLDERAKIKDELTQSPSDIRMTALRTAPKLLDKLQMDDRFLTALGEILLTYVDRRLPKGPRSR